MGGVNTHSHHKVVLNYIEYRSGEDGVDSNMTDLFLVRNDNICRVYDPRLMSGFGSNLSDPAIKKVCG